MSLSPTKHRTLSRQPSSPSLAVGLPPPLPESNIMHPSHSHSHTSLASASSPSKSSMPRTKSRKRIHRGDVSSSAASSGDENDTQITPKRKVISVEAGGSATPASAKKSAKKMTLQERLQAAAAIKEGGVQAKVKKSKSKGESLSASASVPDTSALASSSILSTPAPSTRSEMIVPNTMPVQRAAASASAAGTAGAADKVVVCVRIKPTTNPFVSTAYDLTPTSLSLSDEHPKVKQRGGKAGREDGYTYTFDKLLQHPSTTPMLYADKVAPLIDKAMNGFNSTIFAYGQTGSGKSFTMTGIPEELGIIPCAVDGVFDAITADPDRAFLLRVSYIEIYNETLRDLLNFKKGPLRDDEKPSIHTAKGKVYVDPLVEEIVSTPQDVMDLLERGNAGRRIGATDWNERSSRSHCVFTVVIESRPRDGDGDEDIRLSRLNLIDLAGSEKAVSDSERRGEGRHINQSLLALREVVHKLTEQGKVTHIPYRNSKLTHLLENALGGDSNICVICTMSGEEEHCAETLETLKFAGRCSQVKTNAKKNVLPSSERALIRAKDQEIEELKLRLQGLTGQTAQRVEPEVDQISNLAESVAAMETRKAKLTTQLAKLNGEILTSELPRSGSGLPLSPPKPKRRRISDFSALAGPGRIGLGVGTPNKLSDRRAISGMTRVMESDEEMPGILGTLDSADNLGFKNFDHERALAALRRNLAAKEQELVSANRELSEALAQASQLTDRDARISALEADLRAALDSHASLRTSLEQSERTFRDQTAQLEGTRSELVATIEDKAKKIDELESKVLDLRKSREELALEDQQRLDEVQGKLDQLSAQKEEDQRKINDIEKRLGEWQKKANDAEWFRAEEIEKHKAELSRIIAQQGDVQAAQHQLAEHEKKTANQVKDLLASQSAKEAEIAALQAEKQRAEREKEQARKELDEFQKEAMRNEAKILAELREEIGNLRKGREEDKAAWERTKGELEGRVRDEQTKLAEKAEQLSVAKKSEEELVVLRRSLEDGGVREQKLSTQMADALKTLGEAAKANSTLESRLAEEHNIRRSLEEEKSQMSVRLGEADDLGRKLEDEIAGRRKAEDQLDQLARTVEESQAGEKTQQEAVARETAARKKVEERVAALLIELQTSNNDLMSVKQAKEEAERRSTDLSQQLEAARSSSGDHQARLTQEMEARQAAESRAVEMGRQVEEARISIADKEKMIRSSIEVEQASTKRIEKLVAQVKDMETVQQRLQDDIAAGKLADSRAKDLERQLENILATSGEGEKKLADAMKGRQALEAQVTDLQRQLSEAQAALSEMEKQLRLSESARSLLEKEVEDLRRQLQAAQQGQTDRTQLERSLADATKLREQAESNFVGVTRERDAARSEKARLEEQYKAELIQRQELEQRLIDLTRQASSATDIQGQLGKQLAAVEDLRKRLADSETTTKSLEIKVEVESGARKKAEKGLEEMSRELVGKHEAAQAVLEEELMSVRKTLDAARAENAREKKNAESHRIEAEMTALELERSRAEVEKLASKQIASKSSRSSLRTQSGGSEEEITRLESVIEVQEGIINEQREKIERWAKEMEKQREIVRLLTNGDHAPLSALPNLSSSTASPSIRGHGRSHSVAVNTTASGSGSGKFPSTFTARNLALPSAALPNPLPMHPSQFDNTTTRKGRRVTIEHDMDRLSETSKVNRAKALFESPDKITKPPAGSAGTAGPGAGAGAAGLATPPRPLRTANAVSSVPRQRRP